MLTKQKLILTIALLLTMATAGWAQQTWEIGSPTASDVIAVLDNGTLTISGTGAMANFSFGSTPWYSESNSKMQSS